MDAIQHSPNGTDDGRLRLVGGGLTDVEQGRSALAVPSAPLGHVRHEIEDAADVWESHGVRPGQELVESDPLPVRDVVPTDVGLPRHGQVVDQETPARVLTDLLALEDEFTDVAARSRAREGQCALIEGSKDHCRAGAVMQDGFPELGSVIHSPTSRDYEQPAGEVSVEYPRQVVVHGRLVGSVVVVVVLVELRRLLTVRPTALSVETVARERQNAELVVQVRQSGLLPALDEIDIGEMEAGDRDTGVVSDVEHLYQTVVDVAVVAEGPDEVHSFQTQEGGTLFDVDLPGPPSLGRQGVERQEHAAGSGAEAAVDQHPGVRAVLRLEVAEEVKELDRVMW